MPKSQINVKEQYVTERRTFPKTSHVLLVGWREGCRVGCREGLLLGCAVGRRVGRRVGFPEELQWARLVADG
jgi:hypothetical protein